MILLGAVTLLLCVACANVANLLLARYSARRREMAVRGALGAARGRLIRQLLTESVILGLAGGIAGVVLAYFAVSGLVALAPRDLTRSVQITFDLRIVVFAFLLSLVTSIIFGLAPAIMASHGDLNRGLHEESRTSTGGGTRMRQLAGCAGDCMLRGADGRSGIAVSQLWWDYRMWIPGWTRITFLPSG